MYRIKNCLTKINIQQRLIKSLNSGVVHGKYKYYSLQDKEIKLVNSAFNKLFRFNSALSLDCFSKEFVINAKCSSGMAIEFITTSSSINIKASLIETGYIPHMSEYAIKGMDVYVKTDNEWRWKGCHCPNTSRTNIVDRCVSINNNKNEVTVRIFCPLYSIVDGLSIGVEKSAFIRIRTTSPNYRIVVYGSSITQGCAISRPGKSYTNIISRYYDADVYNFGYSGSAKGENEIAAMLSKVPADLFIMEYDHNATVGELSTTHKAFFERIYRENPRLKFIFMSRLSVGQSISIDEGTRRKCIIENTYKYAIDQGCKALFIDGQKLIIGEMSDYFVDDKHPNDEGTRLIADALIKAINTIETEA